jgi:hypothetical protein
MNEIEALDPFRRLIAPRAGLDELVDRIDALIWDQSILSPALKERARIAAAEALGCLH